MLARASLAAHLTVRPQLRNDSRSLPARPVASAPRRKAHTTPFTMAAIQRHEIGARMSEASVYNGIVHLAGQVADDAEQDITGQTTQVLAQVDRLLALAGSDKTRTGGQIFLKDIKDFPSMNAVWDKWVVVGNTPPRATVQASLANDKWLIEVVVTAAAK